VLSTKDTRVYIHERRLRPIPPTGLSNILYPTQVFYTLLIPQHTDWEVLGEASESLAQYLPLLCWCHVCTVVVGVQSSAIGY
jgi:hypothetical protein